MSWLRTRAQDPVEAAAAAVVASAPNATLTIQPQLMKTMPAATFVVPINLQTTRLKDVMETVARTLAMQASKYPHASAQFDGDVSKLSASLSGFIFEDMGSGLVVARGTAVPPAQHSNRLDLLGVHTSGVTLHVAHHDDVHATLQAMRMHSKAAGNK
jgi:hypothetical protein